MILKPFESLGFFMRYNDKGFSNYILLLHESNFLVMILKLKTNTVIVVMMADAMRTATRAFQRSSSVLKES